MVARERVPESNDWATACDLLSLGCLLICAFAFEENAIAHHAASAANAANQKFLYPSYH